MIVTIDTGGTKTLIAGFDRDGNRGKTVKFDTPVSPDAYTSQLRVALQEHFGDERVEAISLALPGVIEGTTAVWFGNLSWTNFNAAEALAGVFGDIDPPLFVENDANLAGLAETRALNPMPYSSLYVTISTGIGIGLTIDGKIDPGMSHSEAGHIVLEYDGALSQWEKFASGKSIYNRYNKFARDITDPDDWHEIADRISRGFLAVIPIIQPDIIIIGGSVGAYFDRYGSYLEALLKDRLPPYLPCPPFHQAKHPEEAVIYGCYYHALDALDN